MRRIDARPSTWQLNLGIQQPSTFVKVTMMDQLLKTWPLSHQELLNVHDFGSIYKPKITIGSRTPLPLFLKKKILKFTFKKHYIHPLPRLSPDINVLVLSSYSFLFCYFLHIRLDAVSKQLGAGDGCMAP
jgi:hypothetical protein